MGKIISVILIIGIALIFLNREKIEDYKQKAVELINPAAKEKRLLGELGTVLDHLETILVDPGLSAGPAGKITISDKQKLNAAISQAKSTMQALKETNQKIDLGANLSNLIQKILPLDQTLAPTWLPPSPCRG